MTDELWSGVGVVAAPSIEEEQLLDHRGYVLLVFAIPLFIAAVLEGAFAVLSERMPRRRLIAGALLVLSASLVLCALGSSAVTLALGLALAGASSGVACSVAQAELVASRPGATDSAMTRWVLFGAVGDILTPLVLAGVFALGGSYRAALLAIAGVSICQAGLVGSGSIGRAPTPPTDEASELPLALALRRAAGNRRLWLWLFGAAMCTLLDEIVVALATLRIQMDLGSSPGTAAACATTLSLGGAMGALITDRLLTRVHATRILAVSAVSCSLALGWAMAATSVGAIVPALFLVGLAAAPQYALLTARAYDAVPGHPGIVNALSHVFVLVDIIGPLLLGIVADRFGLRTALGCLLAQPLLVGVLLLFVGSRRPVGSDVGG